jgi:hypothetical protein
MNNDPLLTTLLDLDFALQSQPKLIIGGGYGLYLKQTYLAANPELQTLFTLRSLPIARTTQDIDLILRAEIVTDSKSMQKIRAVLDQLKFTVVDTARYTQFTRSMNPGQVKIDLLAAPLGEFTNRVPKDVRRVRPRPSVKLHASKLEEAIAVDRHATIIPVSGSLSNGTVHATEVLIPQAFSYLLMKLFAFRDRVSDVDKDLGQHHALDVYRIVGMLKRDEDPHVRELSKEHSMHPKVVDAQNIAREYFVSETGIGRIRIQEHPLFTAEMDLNRFGAELKLLLGIA